MPGAVVEDLLVNLVGDHDRLGVGQHIRQGRDIQQTQVHALSRQGVDTMGGVADQGQPWQNIAIGMAKTQWKDGTGTDTLDRAQHLLTCLRQLMGE